MTNNMRSQLWLKRLQETQRLRQEMPPATVLAWIRDWDIRDVDTNKRYNTAALVRWKRMIRAIYTAVIMVRDPAVALIFHNGRRLGESIMESRFEEREPRAPRRLLPLGNMVKAELQDEMEENGLEYKGLGCREMRVLLNEQRIQNGQTKKKCSVTDPDLKGIAKMRRAELIALAKKKGIRVTEDMLKDKIICLLQGQVPKAIKKEGDSEPPTTSRAASRGTHSRSAGSEARPSRAARAPTSSGSSGSDKEPKTERDQDAISDPGIVAEDIGVEEDNHWEMIAPHGKTRRKRTDSESPYRR